MLSRVGIGLGLGLDVTFMGCGDGGMCCDGVVGCRGDGRGCQGCFVWAVAARHVGGCPCVRVCGELAVGTGHSAADSRSRDGYVGHVAILVDGGVRRG